MNYLQVDNFSILEILNRNFYNKIFDFLAYENHA